MRRPTMILRFQGHRPFLILCGLSIFGVFGSFLFIPTFRESFQFSEYAVGKRDITERLGYGVRNAEIKSSGGLNFPSVQVTPDTKTNNRTFTSNGGTDLAENEIGNSKSTSNGNAYTPDNKANNSKSTFNENTYTLDNKTNDSKTSSNDNTHRLNNKTITSASTANDNTHISDNRTNNSASTSIDNTHELDNKTNDSKSSSNDNSQATNNKTISNASTSSDSIHTPDNKTNNSKITKSNSDIVSDPTSTYCNTTICTFANKLTSSKDLTNNVISSKDLINKLTSSIDLTNAIISFKDLSNKVTSSKDPIKRTITGSAVTIPDSNSTSIAVTGNSTTVFTTNVPRTDSRIGRNNKRLQATKTEAILPSSVISTGNSSHYLIQTEGCNILDFPLTHPDIVKYTYKEVEELICSKKLPLTEDSGLNLILRDDRIADYGSSKERLICKYQGILRVEQNPNKYNKNCDHKFKLKDAVLMISKETHIDEDAILVTCYDLVKPKKPLYRNVHFFIQPRRAKKKREAFKAENGKDRRNSSKLSVVILGTDSVSRGNLLRHMPRTHDYLKNHLNAISLKGLTKIADNTHPNIIALLTGLSMTELKMQKCRRGSRRESKFDDCPIIWRDFSKKGYVTAYAEDTPHVGSFHHNMYGFVEQPTDYYNRPYYIAAENFTGHSGNIKGAVGWMCLGARKSISVIHNYALAVAEELKDVPYFSYYWTTSMTHDSQVGALRADEPILTYLKKMKEGGYLNHTVLFFISDHGMRQGTFRTTYAGMLEERLPYANIVFPEWFINKYPEAIRNMRDNVNRLTSTYDLHVTLRDILAQNYVDLSKMKPWPLNGQSLFGKISPRRTCWDAGIPDHYCACESTKEADVKDPHLKEAARRTIAELNEGLAAFPDCVQLDLDKVIKGRVGTSRRNTKPLIRDTAITSYMVTFSTLPGNAIMEASVKRRKDNYEVSSDISRINMYGNQSHCIEDEIYRKYCYCKDLLPLR